MTADLAIAAPTSSSRNKSAFRPFELIASLAIVAAGASAGMGCTPPCEALAEQICACELNQREENACLEIIRSSPKRITTLQEDEVCMQRLDTCTCDALEDGELTLCGLAK